jgi:hypothetical protein
MFSVILSGASTKRSEVLAESKDPYSSFGGLVVHSTAAHGRIFVVSSAEITGILRLRISLAPHGRFSAQADNGKNDFC